MANKNDDDEFVRVTCRDDNKIEELWKYIIVRDALNAFDQHPEMADWTNEEKAVWVMNNIHHKHLEFHDPHTQHKD